ncbi:head maturation protease, ClpP-related [Bacillus sp. ISL-57]|uniref:head maturation protease, ClpP-related n=1 Tax=Bacillus sp. ISL-57 TaxID=2819135 RepID=UPI001BEC2D5D|nr:head maturation protease, ClpP-related [Bacillus sp. ISL-57]MBT2717542.1 ATP-dependent Clp protease proteolytic subunit [Bacillus sp. ISL-57]
MKISVKGPIISSNEQWIYDWFGIEATSPKKVSDQLSKLSGEDIDIDINSGGGSVFDASEIYALLKDYKGKKTGKILGLAASAASVIAMAADNLLMAPTAQMMIHNASTRSQGDYRDMDQTSSFLKNVNQTIANAYNLKSGKSYDELLIMMDKETWLTPQQALQHHLIDEIMFEGQGFEFVASADGGMIPQQVIDKIRNELHANPPLNQAEIPAQAAVNQKIIGNEQEEKETMNLEELKNKHPELYNQIRNEGYTEGVKAENSRIKSIEDLQMPGNEALINQAKFETNDSAESVAVQIIKAEKSRGQNYLQNLKEDADPINKVPGSPAPEEGGESDSVKASNLGANIAASINKMRGGIR